MDRTSRIGLFVCFFLLIGFQFALDKIYPPQPYKPKFPVTTPAASATGTAPNSTAQMTSAPGNPAVAPVPAAAVPETLTVIENDALKITFTSAGAAIKEVELKKYRADNGGNIVLNEQAHSNILSLTGWPGADTASFVPQENGADGITYTSDLPNGLKWQRTYAFGKQADTDTGMSGMLREMFHSIALKMGHPDEKPLVYTVDVTDTVTNTGATDVALPGYKLSVGRAAPLIVNGHFQPGPYGYPGSGWLANQFHLMTISAFEPTSYFWVPTGPGKDVITSTSIDSAPLRWIGVENQFFAVLLTPAIERSISSGEYRTFKHPRAQWQHPPDERSRGLRPARLRARHRGGGPFPRTHRAGGQGGLRQLQPLFGPEGFQPARCARRQPGRAHVLRLFRDPDRADAHGAQILVLDL